MLGLALIHLIPDAEADLLEAIPSYNVAGLLTAVGVIVVLFIEQLTLLIAKSYQRIFTENMKVNESIVKSSSQINIDFTEEIDNTKVVNHHEDCGLTNCNHNNTADIFNVNTKKSKKSIKNKSEHEHEHEQVKNEDKLQNEIHNTAVDQFDWILTLDNANSWNALITAYMLEISIAVHSIIIGFDLGILTSVPTFVSLLIAISFHQFIEGLGLGATILGSKTELGNKKLIGFIVIFCFTAPLGVLIGILSSSESENNAQIIAIGVANAFAAGSLLYISLTEMIASYFKISDAPDKPYLKLQMSCFLTLGVAFTALLAVWA
jgi:zinc transporter ZupT